jgi:hypothetical protein
VTFNNCKFIYNIIKSKFVTNFILYTSRSQPGFPGTPGLGERPLGVPREIVEGYTSYVYKRRAFMFTLVCFNY